MQKLEKLKKVIKIFLTLNKFFIKFKGFNSSPLSKLSLIDFAVASELSLSPCIHTESISQGICFPL